LTKEDAIKTETGYTEVGRLYKIPESDLADLSKVLALMCRSEPMPFSWSKEDIDNLYGMVNNAQSELDDDENPRESNARDGIVIPATGKFYIMQPGYGDLSFWLGECVRVQQKEGKLGMLVNYYELCNEQEVEGDLDKELLGPREARLQERTSNLQDFDWVPITCIWLQVDTACTNKKKKSEWLSRTLGKYEPWLLVGATRMESWTGGQVVKMTIRY